VGPLVAGRTKPSPRQGSPARARSSRSERATPALRLHAFADSAAFARSLARQAGIACTAIDEHRFPDGESLVRVRQPTGRHAVLVRTLHEPNAKLVEVALAADALRRAGAKRVTLVAPYLPYMRQDVVFSAGEPVSQRVIGAWLGATFDRVLTVEAHLHRIRSLAEVVPTRARSVSAAPALAGWIRRRGGPGCVIVGPDVESEPWVRALAHAARLPFVVGAKERSGDIEVDVRLPGLPRAKRALIVDDIASSGQTLARTARALRAAGVSTIEAAVVHAVFAPGALARIRRAGIQRIVSCDTIAHPTNAVPVARLLAPLLSARL
jgi:ribose-phosphate pyrophosphokinase